MDQSIEEFDINNLNSKFYFLLKDKYDELKNNHDMLHIQNTLITKKLNDTNYGIELRETNNEKQNAIDSLVNTNNELNKILEENNKNNKNYWNLYIPRLF